jgi:hypothetical protein
MYTEQNTGSHRRTQERLEDAQTAAVQQVRGSLPVCPRCGTTLYRGWCEAHGKQEEQTGK